MSYTEIRQEGGMPYGGMPHDALLYRLEETDPELVADVRGDDPFFDPEDQYDLYARAEIVDWTPDAPYLESDHPRRDPALPRSILNLRLAGGRGPNDYRLPQHPELFLGFTGNDPRGADTQPRLDRTRAQMAARARNEEVRMGHNVGHGDYVEADRPWTGPALEYSKKEAQRRLKGYWHWFRAQKEGRPWGRNTVADRFYGVRERRGLLGDGAESLYVPEQGQPDAGKAAGLTSARGWLQLGPEGPVRGAEGGGVRRVDRPGESETAPWRHITGGASLAVERYAATAPGGRELSSPAAAGGGRAAVTRADRRFGAQAWRRGGGNRWVKAAAGGLGVGGARVGAVRAGQAHGAHTQGRAANRRLLAENMSAAAASRRARGREKGGDAPHGSSATAPRNGRSAGELARAVACAARHMRQEQSGRPPGAIQEGEGGGLGPAAGLGGPPADRQAAVRAGRLGQPAAANARLADARAMVRGLREGTAAQLRGAQGRTELGSALGPSAGGGPPAVFGGGLLPASEVGAARHRVPPSPWARAAAARGLEPHHYGRASWTAVRGEAEAVASAQSAGFTSAGAALGGRRAGQAKRPEFRSHSQMPAALGAHQDRVFGAVGKGAWAHTGALSVGGKKIRASGLADGGDDVMGAREDLAPALSEAGRAPGAGRGGLLRA